MHMHFFMEVLSQQRTYETDEREKQMLVLEFISLSPLKLCHYDKVLFHARTIKVNPTQVHEQMSGPVFLNNEYIKGPNRILWLPWDKDQIVTESDEVKV